MQFGLTFLHPRLVMPLFHDIRPLDDPATLEAVTDVAHRAGVEIGRVRVIDAGRYSAHTNAFFIGFGKFKDIYLYDTLVEGRTPEEVASTFAHEAGHWTRNHVAKGIALASAGTILACLLLYFGFPVLARAPFLKIGPIGDVASLPMLAMLASVAGFLTAPVVNTVSRNFEREADRISLELTGSPEIYLSGFRKLAEENLSFLTPHPLVVAWRHTHPPIVERLQAARDAVQIAP
jgi:STE24 endopeptidase